MRAAAMLLALLLLEACAAQLKLTKAAYHFADNPVGRNIELTYRNETARTMCLRPEHWPNQAGKINQASDRMVLLIGGQRFPVPDFNTRYCPDGCAMRVAPGAELKGRVSYADFAVPEHLWKAAKTLEFSPMEYPCSAH